MNEELMSRALVLESNGLIERNEGGKFGMTDKGGHAGMIYLIDQGVKKHLPELGSCKNPVMVDKAHYNHLLNCLERDGLIIQDDNKVRFSPDGIRTALRFFLSGDIKEIRRYVR